VFRRLVSLQRELLIALPQESDPLTASPKKTPKLRGRIRGRETTSNADDGQRFIRRNARLANRIAKRASSNQEMR
jgi:hypothetical protein